jgi:hypothetical protein
VSPVEATDEIRDLLVDAVDSIEKLEVLVDLHEHEGASSAVIAKRRGIPERLVVEAVAPLVGAGLVHHAPPFYCYRWNNARADTVSSLMQLYDEDRIVVLHLITQLAIRRVRSAAASMFGGVRK